METRKRITKILFFALFALSCAGCEEPDYPVELHIKVNSTNADYFKKAIDRYVFSNSLEGKLSYVLDDATGDASGTDSFQRNDIALLETHLLGRYVNEGKIKPLPSAEADFLQSNFDALSVNSVTIGNNLYGFPLYSTSYAFFYDSRQLDKEEVQTFESLTAALEKKNLHAGFSYDNFYFQDAFFSSFGVFTKQGIKENGESFVAFDNFDSEAGRKAIKAFAPIVKSNVYKDVFQTSDQAAKIPMSYHYDELKGKWGDNLVCAPMPISEKQASLPFLHTCYVLFDHASNAKRNAATNLIKFLSNAENQLDYCLSREYLPTSKDAQKKVGSDGFLQICLQNKANGYSAFPPVDPLWMNAYSNLVTEVRELPENYADSDIDAIIAHYEAGLKGAK